MDADVSGQASVCVQSMIVHWQMFQVKFSVCTIHDGSLLVTKGVEPVDAGVPGQV